MLKELIEQLGLAGTSAAEAKATLEAKTVEVHATDPVMLNSVVKKIGPPAWLVMRQKVKESPFEGLLDVVISGADFRDPVTTEAIAGLVQAGVITQDEADAVNSAVVWTVSPLEDAGLGPTVETAAIEAAQEQIADQAAREAFQQEWASMLNEAGINAALAAVDRDALVVALRLTADRLETSQ